VTDTRIVLLGNASSDPLAKTLGKSGRALTRVENARAVLAAAADQDVIVLDVLAGTSIVDLAKEIRAVPELAEVPILAITASDDVEERIKLLEAGADDVMIRPVDDRELDARVEALDLRHRRSKELRGPSMLVATTRRPGKRLIAVYSPKGGVGSTTVAVNLALAIAARSPDQTALVDLSPMGGQVATHLDLKPRLTIADLIRDSAGMISPEILRTTYLTRHDAGLLVLAGSTAPNTQPLMPGAEATRILEAVLAAVPTVVVDLGSSLDDRVMAAIDASDDVIFVVTPDFPALKSVHGMLEYLGEAGGQRAEPMIVVNETYALQTLTPGDIETALGRRVAIRIPYDPLLYLRAANAGTPVFASAPTSQPSRRFDQLAGVVLGEDAPASLTESRRRGPGRFFGRS
jgi:pilus assembly protein CpaE